MNSPDPGSPISTDSSGSPPPDDLQLLSTGPSGRDPHTSILHSATNNMLGNITSMIPIPSPGSKRRLPGGPSFDGHSSRRDAKTRKREDIVTGNPRRFTESQAQSAGGSGFGQAASNPWGAKSEHGIRRDKEDLLDVLMMEQLRKEFGDPFLETAIKSLR